MNTPKVHYEDNHLIIVEKPPGLLVQADDTKDGTLTDWAAAYIQKKYKKPGRAFCHPCHRLDRPVGGLVIFARTSKGLERMNELFRNQEVEKSYLAIVDGTPLEPMKTLVHFLEKDTKKNKAHTRKKGGGNAKRAELSYSLIATHSHISLLLVKPKTGRPHQIRIQLRENETPIKGDTKYGYPKMNKDKNISLHAYKLSFIHPVKKEPVTVISRPDWPEFEAFYR
ncbi:MAG: RluA family pseudouridine synthase [Bacteroidota bacterium]